MKGRWIPYTAAELAWLEANCTLSIRAYRAAFVGAFQRPEITEANLHALRKRKGWRTGRTGYFAKGHETHNKGKPFPVAANHPNCKRTQFRKGERRGVAVKLYQPIGTIRVTKDGYLSQKVNDGMPLQARWRLLHLVKWEAINGPLPKGHALKCLDGNVKNTEPANWTLIPRAILPRLASGNGRGKKKLAYDEAPPELKPVILAVARLEHAAREKSA